MMKNYAKKSLCHLGRSFGAKSIINNEKIPPKSLFAIWAEVLAPKVQKNDEKNTAKKFVAENILDRRR
jgi:hypothetical protein